MVSLILERRESTDEGTFGNLVLDGTVYYTAELPWRDNQPNISCVPTGTYLVAWAYSHRLAGYGYLLGAVPRRAGIRIHPANLPTQLLGCVALGERRGWIDGKKAVLLSRPAVSRFAATLDRQPFELEIK